MRAQPHAPTVVAALAAILTVPAVYAALRVLEVLFFREPDPARVVWSPHIALFWRLATAGYVAVLVAILAHLAARRDIGRTARVLCGAAPIVALLIAAQGLVLP